MPQRLLHFRLAFALLGVMAMIAGAMLDLGWLVLPGALTAGVGEVIGLAQSKARFSTAASRTLRGTAEALPSVGVSAMDPWALWITVGVVVYALMANGLHTVGVARGVELERTRGETLRRVMTALAGLLVLVVPASTAAGLDAPGRLGSSSREVIVVCFAVVLLAGARALTDMAMGLRRT